MHDPTPSNAGAPALTWRQEAGALWRLSVPVVTAQVGMMLMGVVDVAMIGHFSRDAAAATLLGHVYVFGVLIFCMGVLFVLDPLIAHAVGAKDHASIALHVQRGLWLSALLTVPLILACLPARAVLTFLGQPQDIVPDAAGYVLASAPGVLPFLAFIVLRQSLQAMSRTAPIVVAVIVANVANALLDLVLIFGWLGLPASGAVGCAWATTICRVLLLVLVAALGWRSLRPQLWPLQREARSARGLRRMLARGAPIGGAHVLEYWAFFGTALLMGRIGTLAMAGHQVAINLAGLTFMVPLGIANAAAVRVGYAVGRRDRVGAGRAAAIALLGGAGIMTVFAVAFIGWPRLFAGLYTDRADVLTAAATLIPLAGTFQVFDGLQVVATGVLRGLGKTRAPIFAQFVAFWLIGLPVGTLLAFRVGLAERGLWWGLVLGLAVAAGVLLALVRRGLRHGVERMH